MSHPYQPHPSSSRLPITSYPQPPGSLSFMLGPSKTQSQRQPNPYPSPGGPSSSDAEYLAKYKDMKRKVKEIELDNDRNHLKCLKIRKNIQRLRLERAILYEHLSAISTAEPLLPGEPGSLPGTYSQPPIQEQEQYPYSMPPPDIQARMQADRERPLPQAMQHSYHVFSTQGSPPIDVSRGPLPQAPPRHYAQHPGEILQTGHPQSNIPAHLLPAPGPAPTRRNSATAGGQNQPLPPPKYQGIRNGGARTFPFVLEYPPYNKPGEPVPAPPSYPSEIRFHQYDASDRPVHRSRRDADRDAEKGSRYKRRPQESEREYGPPPPEPRPHSPAAGPSNSPHGGYAYPLQHPFLSSERECQPRHVPPEGDREPQRPSRVQEVHPEDQRRYEAERNSFGAGSGHAYHQQREYEPGPQGECSQATARHSPVNRRSYSEPDEEQSDSYERYKRDDPRAQPRNVEDDGRFTHVQDVQVMD